MSSVSCNAGSQSFAQFLDYTVDHSLFKTVALLDTMAQLFHFLDLVSVNTVPAPHNQLDLDQDCWTTTVRTE